MRRPDEVGRRGEVRLVANAAGRVEAHGRGRPVGAQVERQVAGHAVVGGDDQRRAVARTRADSSSAAIRNGRSEDEAKARCGAPAAASREALDVVVLEGSV